MTEKFIFTRNIFVLTCTNVWIEVDGWTEWQNVSQTWNCFDSTVSSIEIDRFIDAAGEGDVSTVNELLEEGVPVDCSYDRTYDRTALFYAALNNRTDVIRLLLQNGANANNRDLDGNTPVHHAAMYNSTEAIAVLMEYEASIDIKNNKGEKPIDVARRLEKKQQFVYSNNYK